MRGTHARGRARRPRRLRDARPDHGSLSWSHRVADLGPFDLLDVSASCDAEGRDLTLVVVNRDPEREIETTIQLADSTF